MSRVLVVGGINQDVVVLAERRPGDGETVLGRGPRYAGGGKGANMAVAAARAGAAGVEAGLCAAVGLDAAGREQLRLLAEAGVDVSAVARREDHPTGVALIVVTPDGENSIAVGPGANVTLAPHEVEGAAAGADVVLAQSEVGVAAVDVAAAAAVRLVLSLAPVLAVDPATLAAADPLVVNALEAADLGARGPDGTAVAADLLHRAGCRSVVVTLGERGAVVADAGGVSAVASPEVSVVDTTGAGDALAGVLAAHLAGGTDLRQATRLAVVAAASVVTRTGAR